MNIIFKLVISVLIFSAPTSAFAKLVAGFNLTETDGFLYDAATGTAPKTLAQIAVDEAKRLGSNHIILNVRATMRGPFSTEIIPNTPPAERSKEALRMARLIKYIQSQGMTAGIRPIFFVVGPNGEFPYIVKKDGKDFTWWHGNIQPADPDRWFESFRVFMDAYITVARMAKADEFTIGAELYSMTVGIEDQWKEHPYGFPGRWLELLRYTRSKIPNARLMYDINFTDDSIDNSGISASGGEFERWRYRLVELAHPKNEAEALIWQDLSAFWKELDAIGLDIYRSLASHGQKLPVNYNELVLALTDRAMSYATQLDTGLMEIDFTLEHSSKAIVKEIGVRSVENGFIDPFAYAGTGKLNLEHQAAGFEALFRAFWAPQWPWFEGINFWDIAVDPTKKGPQDTGFSPLGKPETEAIILNYFGRP